MNIRNLSLTDVNTVEFRNRSEVHLALSNFGKKIMEANCHSNYIKRDVAWFDSSGAALIDTILRSTEAALAATSTKLTCEASREIDQCKAESDYSPNVSARCSVPKGSHDDRPHPFKGATVTRVIAERPCAVCGQPPDFAKHWGTAADPAPVGNHDYT